MTKILSDATYDQTGYDLERRYPSFCFANKHKQPDLNDSHYLCKTFESEPNYLDRVKSFFSMRSNSLATTDL